MLPATDDPFELLGVDRDVDERTLKKRYFALIRSYPPETHPEEFSRIHEAYSQLSDPETRAKIAQGGDFGEVAEPFRTRLREAVEQLRTDRVELGLTALDQLVREEPSLLQARELLEKVLLSLGRAAEAEAHIRTSIQQQPGRVVLHLRLAQALSLQKQWDEALSQCDIARELSKGLDPSPWTIGAELLAEAGRLGDAMRRLEEGVAQVANPEPLIFTRIFLGRRQIGLAGLLSDLALLEALHSADKTSARAELSHNLRRLAAAFFNIHKPELANVLLRQAAKLSGSVAMTFPAKVEIAIDELPAESQAWLEAERSEPHIFHLPSRALELEVGAALGSAVVAGLAAGGMLLSGAKLSWLLGLVPLLFAGFLGVGWALDRLASLRGGPLRLITAVHPLYFLRISRDHVTAYPLLSIVNVSGQHLHRNGAYLHTEVSITFPGETVRLKVASPAKSEELMELLVGYRDRGIDIMSSGLFEADRDYQLIPAELLDPARVSPTLGLRARERARRLTASAAFATVCAAVGIFATSAQGSARRWASVINTQNIPALVQAMDQAPTRAAKAEALEYVRRRLQDIGPTLEPPPGVPDKRARAEPIMGALREAPTPLLMLRWRSAEAPGLTKEPFVDGFNRALDARVAKVIALGTDTGLVVEVQAQPYASGQHLRRGPDQLELQALKLEVKALTFSFPVDVRLGAEDIERLPANTELGPAATLALLEKAGSAVAFELGLSGSLSGL